MTKELLKRDWKVEGTVTMRDDSTEPVRDNWQGKTFDEADAELERLAAEHLRRRGVRRVALAATSDGPGGFSVITQLVSK